MERDTQSILVEMLKTRITILKIELRDALFMAYGSRVNWPERAVAALGDGEESQDAK